MTAHEPVRNATERLDAALLAHAEGALGEIDQARVAALIAAQPELARRVERLHAEGVQLRALLERPSAPTQLDELRRARIRIAAGTRGAAATSRSAWWWSGRVAAAVLLAGVIGGLAMPAISRARRNAPLSTAQREQMLAAANAQSAMSSYYQHGQTGPALGGADAGSDDAASRWYANTTNANRLFFGEEINGLTQGLPTWRANPIRFADDDSKNVINDGSSDDRVLGNDIYGYIKSSDGAEVQDECKFLLRNRTSANVTADAFAYDASRVLREPAYKLGWNYRAPVAQGQASIYPQAVTYGRVPAVQSGERIQEDASKQMDQSGQAAALAWARTNSSGATYRPEEGKTPSTFGQGPADHSLAAIGLVYGSDVRLARQPVAGAKVPAQRFMPGEKPETENEVDDFAAMRGRVPGYDSAGIVDGRSVVKKDARVDRTWALDGARVVPGQQILENVDFVGGFVADGVGRAEELDVREGRVRRPVAGSDADGDRHAWEAAAPADPVVNAAADLATDDQPLAVKEAGAEQSLKQARSREQAILMNRPDRAVAQYAEQTLDEREDLAGNTIVSGKLPSSRADAAIPAKAPHWLGGYWSDRSVVPAGNALATSPQAQVAWEWQRGAQADQSATFREQLAVSNTHREGLKHLAQVSREVVSRLGERGLDIVSVDGQQDLGAVLVPDHQALDGKPAVVEQESDDNNTLAELTRCERASSMNGFGTVTMFPGPKLEVPAPAAPPAAAAVVTERPATPAASAVPPPPVNPWTLTEHDALSTFALESDDASFAVAADHIRRGYLPPVGTVRMEEFINAFEYHDPASSQVFTIHSELGPAPHGPQGTQLLRIGVKGTVLGRDQQRPVHLVLVVDSSGSMDREDRLPLVRRTLRTVVQGLAPQDRVSLVTFGSTRSLLVEAQAVGDGKDLVTAIDALQAAGPSDVMAGLRLGLETAARQYRDGAINQVLLCSDGVANVGKTDREQILADIDGWRKQGIATSTLGFGVGGYDDGLLERIAGRGDGQYRFIDGPEAITAVAGHLAAGMQMIARDAKIQVSFDPARVRRFRLIGYENRALQHEEFRNDSVDAGEIGSGQAATALYEVELHDAADRLTPVGEVRVRYRDVADGSIAEAGQLLDGDGGYIAIASQPRWHLAAAAAEFAELLRGSEHAQDGDLDRLVHHVEAIAAHLPFDDGVARLLELVRAARGLPRAQ